MQLADNWCDACRLSRLPSELYERWTGVKLSPSQARWFDMSMIRAAKVNRLFDEMEAARSRGDKDLFGTGAIAHTARAEHMRS